MAKSILWAMIWVFLAWPVFAAEKIRIGFPEFNSSTFTLPMAHIKGFFQEEGLQAELIRIRSAIALPSLTSGEIDYHTVVAPAVTLTEAEVISHCKAHPEEFMVPRQVEFRSELPKTGSGKIRKMDLL